MEPCLSPLPTNNREQYFWILFFSLFGILYFVIKCACRAVEGDMDFIEKEWLLWKSKLSYSHGQNGFNFDHDCNSIYFFQSNLSFSVKSVSPPMALQVWTELQTMPVDIPVVLKVGIRIPLGRSWLYFRGNHKKLCGSILNSGTGHHHLGTVYSGWK